VVSAVLVADADGDASVPQAVRDQWDHLDWCVAKSGSDSLAQIRAGVRPKVAVINLQLPDMCGAELVERLRKGLPNLLVVVTSNIDGSLAERLARSLGVVAYWPKPLNGDLLDQVLAAAMSGSGEVRKSSVGSDVPGEE
jgi:DNA-binding NarL/FixJ family response regulator